MKSYPSTFNQSSSIEIVVQVDDGKCSLSLFHSISHVIVIMKNTYYASNWQEDNFQSQWLAKWNCKYDFYALQST